MLPSFSSADVGGDEFVPDQGGSGQVVLGTTRQSIVRVYPSFGNDFENNSQLLFTLADSFYMIRTIPCKKKFMSFR